MKHLVTIILILNIFSGYFAEAFQGDSMDCQSTYQIEHSKQESPSNDQNSEGHSDRECLAIHCHFGHCANLVTVSNVPLLFVKSTESISDKTLNPKEFIFDILRPPITA